MRKYLLFASALYCILFFALFPLYRYIVDFDATGYINVARSYARGDYQTAINGFWSPLGSWLLVPFLKMGYDPVLTAKYINGVLGLASVVSFYCLMKKVLLHETVKTVFLFAIVPILLFYCFFELFGDLLQVFILLVYLNVVCSKDFIRTSWKLILCGVIGALGYYSKYYTFYFFLLHFSITACLLVRHNNMNPVWASLVKKLALTFVTLLMLLIPWWYAISNKYGKFTTSTAGKLNVTWRLTPYLEQQKALISPPPHALGNTDWDDPSYLKVAHRSPFDNIQYFTEEVKIISGNTRTLLTLLNEFSYLGITILLMALYLAFKRKSYFTGNINHVILLSFILTLPLGYLPILIEQRYIWAAGITLFIVAGVLLSICFYQNRIRKKMFLPAALIIAVTFILHPVDKMLEMRYSGKALHEMAMALKKNSIKGKLMSKWNDPHSISRTGILCFLSDNQSYGPRGVTTEEEVLQSIKENNIDYYLWYYNSEEEMEIIKKSLLASNAASLREDIYPGLLIAKFK